MNKIEQHISRQTETMKSWTSAIPKIKAEFQALHRRIAELEANHSKALKRIQKLEQTPRQDGILQKIKGALK